MHSILRRGPSLVALSLVALAAPLAAQRTRADAIALYQATYTNDPEEIVLALQSLVTPSDDLSFAFAVTSLSIPEPSWVVYADLSPNADFGHPTQVFLVPESLASTTITQYDGDSWIVLNGTSFYSDTDALDVSPDKVSGSFPAGAICVPAAGGLPAGTGMGNVWGIVVSGSGDKRHQNANPRWLMEAHPDVSSWTTLGLNGAAIPTKQQICDAIDAVGSMSCDKVYFIFTGHGSHDACALHLDNGENDGKGEFLDGCELGDKLAGMDTADICVVINSCFAEKILNGICQKLAPLPIPSSGIGASQAWKTGMACRCFSLFAKFYHECIDNPVPGKTLKECIDDKLAAVAQANCSFKPWCYPSSGSGAATRSTEPQKSVTQHWGKPRKVCVTEDITVSQVWTPDNVYDLKDQIYVSEGATLRIDPGTVIASTPSVNGAGSLAVSKGSQIFVCGTAEAPVVMTSTADTATWVDCNPKSGTYRPGVCAEWGNLTVMGCAYMNDCKVPANTATCDPANQGVMEGLVEDFPGDPKVRYGGGDDEDDSGKIEYLSLRYGGRVIALTSELNGLSLGAVGRETDIHHVEVVSNVDDGIEVWGGTVNLKHLVVWNVGDDSIDLDQGYRGKIQFPFVVQGYSCAAPQGSGVGDNCFEADGAETSDRQPVTRTAVYNATVVGQPVSGDHATAWRDEAGVQYRNCIFMDIGDRLVSFDNVDGDPCGTGYGFGGTLPWNVAGAANDFWDTLASVTSPVNPCPSPATTYTAQDPTGFLAEIRSSCFFNVGSVTEATSVGVFNPTLGNATVGASPIRMLTRGAPIVIGSNTMLPVTAIDPLPSGPVPASSAPDDGFYCSAPYKGAFAPSGSANWACGWTAMDAFGVLVVPAATVARNGGSNPSSFSGSTFTLGDPWSFSVDLTTTGHALAAVIGYDTPFSFPLAGGQTLLCLDLGGSGELLSLPLAVGPIAGFGGTVPNASFLCGLAFCAQAIHLGGVTPFALSNALDVTVGN